MIDEAMRRFVDEQRLGYVATVCPDGTPNLSPKGTTMVFDGDHLTFADIRSPGTVENLRHNPSVEVNVIDPLARKGYRFKGTARLFDAGPEFEAGVAFFRARGVTSQIRHVVVIHVTRALPVTSPAYDVGATEEQLRLRWAEYYGYGNSTKPRNMNATDG